MGSKENDFKLTSTSPHFSAAFNKDFVFWKESLGLSVSVRTTGVILLSGIVSLAGNVCKNEGRALRLQYFSVGWGKNIVI